MTITFEGAQVYLPGESAETSVTIEDGIIAQIGGPARGERINARGRILAPALIDVHGGAFERQMMPRPGVFFPIQTAVLETDRQLAANGIATAYHALTFSYEPGLRSPKQGRSFLQALEDLAPRLTVENRVQLRWETFAHDAIEVLEAALSADPAPSLAFNDHLSMSMRAKGVSVQDRRFEHDPDFALMDRSDTALFETRHRAHAARAGMTLEAYRDLIWDIWERRGSVLPNIRAVADMARAHNVPMLSHDDTCDEARRFYRDLGARVAEFPMTMEAIRSARSAGDAIILGAPNAVRGKSHIGSVAAGDMVEAGLCDALASDYYYPAMLAAIARLDAERRAPRTDLWALVSAGPARAMNLSDRGSIAPGKRADLVLADWPEGQTPAICGTWVAGRCAYRSTPRG